MAIYYKVTNVSARSTKGERAHFLIEAGKLIKPGETLYNLRRLTARTKERAADLGLDVVKQSMPFEEPPAADKAKKTEAKVVVIEVADEPAMPGPVIAKPEIKAYEPAPKPEPYTPEPKPEADTPEPKLSKKAKKAAKANKSKASSDS
jgi:hypothetical protein